MSSKSTGCDILAFLGFNSTGIVDARWLPPPPPSKDDGLAKASQVAAKAGDLAAVRDDCEKLQALPDGEWWVNNSLGSAILTAVEHDFVHITRFLLEHGVKPSNSHAESP